MNSIPKKTSNANKSLFIPPPAPTPPIKRLQYGLGTFLAVTTLAGPLLVAAITLPSEFYDLQGWILSIAALVFGLAYLLSYAPPYVAVVAVVIAALVAMVVHVQVSVDPSTPNPEASFLPILASWLFLFSTGSGLVLSLSRHAK
ncbi:MAG: hypothetical protein AAF497_28195 [Planctomycetota bacterium]